MDIGFERKGGQSMKALSKVAVYNALSNNPYNAQVYFAAGNIEHIEKVPFIVYERLQDPDYIRRDNQTHIRKLTIGIHFFSDTAAQTIDKLIDSEFDGQLTSFNFDKETKLFERLYEVTIYTDWEAW